MARKDWIKLPMEVFEKGLKPTEACVLAVLIDRAKSTDWTAKITQKRIAETLNISVRTVQTALGWLERMGYISSRRTDRACYYDINKKAQIEPKKPENGQKTDNFDAIADYNDEYPKGLNSVDEYGEAIKARLNFYRSHGKTGKGA